MMSLSRWLALLTSLHFVSAGINRILLHETAAWSLSNTYGYDNFTLNHVSLPSYALDLLHRQGIIGDPLYRYNERELSWVMNDTLTYSGLFLANADSGVAGPSACVERSCMLRFGGIDTAADITLNGHILGRVANAHRAHAFDVGALLEAHVNNSLQVTIHSAPRYARQQADVYPYIVPYSHQLGSVGQYNFIRKAASDFGWDWAGAFAPAGISKSVELIIYDQALLMDVAVRQEHHENGSITLCAEAYLSPAVAMESGLLELTLFGNRKDLTDPVGEPQKMWTSRTKIRFSQAEAGHLINDGASFWAFYAHTTASPTNWAPRNASIDAGINAPLFVRRTICLRLDPPVELDLWWPWDAALGHNRNRRPALYDITLSYRTFSTRIHETTDTPGAGFVVQKMHRKIGLRTVELKRNPTASGSGETFEFWVNNERIFARGANVIPIDIYETREEEERLHAMVAAARSGNFNMLRVWGGGRYFPDAFYEAADDAGILVWQEFAFACAMYPRDHPFLQDVAEEARQQFLRLQYHPSIVIWGGNNENEAAMEWFSETQRNPNLYTTDYVTLFVDLLRSIVASIDKNALYVDSSPTNGVFKFNYEQATYVKRWGDVTDPSYGDVHYYNYKDDLLDPNTYPSARFVSEFGCMSLPSFDSYKTQTAPEDWSLHSPMMEFRMRHAGGMQELRDQVYRHFACQQEKNSKQCPGLTVVMANHHQFEGLLATERVTVDSFRAFLYLTQLHQALAYGTAASRWRRGKADTAAPTAGMLYWQMNDVWAGPSWSGINADGRWKALHYEAQKFFAPVALFGVVRREKQVWVEAWMVNDKSLDVTGTLTVEAIPFSARLQSDVMTLADDVGVEVKAFDTANVWMMENTLQPKEFFLQLRFCSLADEFDLSGSSSCSESHIMLAEPKDCSMAEGSRITIVNVTELRYGDGTTFSVTLRADDGVAVWVLLESTFIGTFSDNLFFLLPWVPKEVQFVSKQDAFGPDVFYKSLTITWLQGNMEKRNKLVSDSHDQHMMQLSHISIDDLFLTKAVMATS